MVPNGARQIRVITYTEHLSPQAAPQQGYSPHLQHVVNYPVDTFITIHPTKETIARKLRENSGISKGYFSPF
jgi:hypothetical protein